MNTGPPDGGSWAPERLFVYGSLVAPGCLDKVLGHKHLGERLRARLMGYERIASATYLYPYIVEAHGQSVDGVVLMDLSPRDMQALDRYEDVDAGVYRRQLVEVEAWGCGPHALRLVAHAYVAGPALSAVTHQGPAHNGSTTSQPHRNG
jgi:gamma-glutamylcyclotransferase (GGCT)/AIG2-like uncharacterized protein YtfP